ncbi:2-hydroxyacyl-CoA dehydratase subunit D [Chloroflexota bacterium]
MSVVEFVPARLKTEERLRELTADYWKKAREAKASGKPIVWCNTLAPEEIFRAMGVFPISTENHAALCGATKVSTGLCEVSERYGYSRDICSYAQTDIGSVLAGEATKSPVKPPEPDILVVANGQCHTVTKWLESLSKLFNIPLFLIDMPFIHDDAGEDTISEARDYVKEQLKEMIAFIEGFTSSRLDYSRLQECFEYSGQLCRLWEEILDLRQNIPSPISAFDIFSNIVPIITMRGTPEGVTYYEQLKAEVADRVALKIGAVPDERFRLHLDGVPCWFDLKYLATKFTSYSACTVTHVYPPVFGVFSSLDPSRPFDTFAEALLKSFINLGVRQRADKIIMLAKKYHLDGLVMQMSRTCKVLCAGELEICDIVERELGLPSLVYETDMCDSRLHSISHIDSRIDVFMEVLATRKNRA